MKIYLKNQKQTSERHLCVRCADKPTCASLLQSPLVKLFSSLAPHPPPPPLAPVKILLNRHQNNLNLLCSILQVQTLLFSQQTDHSVYGLSWQSDTRQQPKDLFKNEDLHQLISEIWCWKYMHKLGSYLHELTMEKAFVYCVGESFGNQITHLHIELYDL